MNREKAEMYTEHALDGIFNYELHEEIARTTTAIVYRATCKKGRLRNRPVAVKKIHTSTSKHPSRGNTSPVISIHSTLCHPSIISLLSAFDAPFGRFQVYELCSEGTLADLLYARDTHSIIEAELKSVARSLVDALIYLKKGLVIHRDINPANILIADDHRVKLSGFGSAVKLPTAESTVTEFCGSANYVAPEILCARPYNFAVDLWSLGCVFLACVSGSPAFDAPSPDQVYANICSAKYTLPNTASEEAKNLIQSMLEKNPHDRIQLHRLHGHSFFGPSLPASPLDLSVMRVRSRHLSRYNLSLSKIKPTKSPSNRYPTRLSKDPGRPRPATLSFQTKPKQRGPTRRIPFEDITNEYTNRPQDIGGEALLGPPPIRTASAPAFSCTPGVSGTTQLVGPQQPASALAAGSGTLRLSSGSTLDHYGPSSHVNSPLVPNPSGGNNHSEHFSPRPQLRRVLSDSHGLLDFRRVTSLSSTRQNLHSASRPIEVLQPRIPSQATSITAVAHPTNQLGIGFWKPKPVTAASQGDPGQIHLDTGRLKPQTHKVSRGQLVVLPSRSLLVDFREGERRIGGKGREVLVISPDGRRVQVYDAPHLSTPCCLAEATATYDLQDLPQKYAKLYNDVSRLVDQLKSRIPKVCLPVNYSALYTRLPRRS
ncbi:kinase-like domain-containing protein [Trametes meyenii]|nr:kinase-like domain-containing protein [Trametes meyenii]